MAVAALRETDGGFASGMLTGAAQLSQRRQVELVGAAIGRELRVQELSEIEAREHFADSEQPKFIDAILQFIAAAANGGSPATNTVATVLSGPALPFDQWAREHAHDLQ